MQNTTLPIIKQSNDGKGFYNLPTSPTTDMIMQTLGTDGDLTRLKAGTEATRSKNVISTRGNGKARQIEVVSNNHQLLIELADIEKLAGSRKGVKKIFLYSLIAINEQAYSVDHDKGVGVMRQNHVEYSLQSLVDAGLYKNVDTARKGFKAAASALTSMKIKGKLTETKGKKRTTVVEALEVMFTGANIKNGQCTVYLNDRIDWGFVAKFYTVIPRYCFKLGVNAFDLVYYIFYLARQRIDDIKQRGYFTIGFRAIHYRLGLPSEANNSNPSRTIKEPIDAAITEIEDASHDSEFMITPVYDEKAPIKEYLDNGYLKIEMKGEYARMFLELADNKTKKIDKAKAKSEKIEALAKAKVLADKLKQEQATE